MCNNSDIIHAWVPTIEITGCMAVLSLWINALSDYKMYTTSENPVKKQFLGNLQGIFAVNGQDKFEIGRFSYAVMVANTICPRQATSV